MGVVHSLFLEIEYPALLQTYKNELPVFNKSITKMRRKIQLPPLLSEIPSERLVEVSVFRKLLVDKFYDYGYLDVYDSVFRQRVDSFLTYIKFEEDECLTKKQNDLCKLILKIGKEIQETNSSEVKLYIKFFRCIEQIFE